MIDTILKRLKWNTTLNGSIAVVTDEYFANLNQLQLSSPDYNSSSSNKLEMETKLRICCLPEQLSIASSTIQWKYSTAGPM